MMCDDCFQCDTDVFDDKDIKKKSAQNPATEAQQGAVSLIEKCLSVQNLCLIGECSQCLLTLVYAHV